MNKKQKGTITLTGLTIEVYVLDKRRDYGKDRYLITPVSGEGERWVENVLLEDNKQ